jgi:DNA-binding CsgD family transcriptional regulator
MNQISLSFSRLSHATPLPARHGGIHPPANESLFVVRVSHFRNDEAASRIRSALPGASIVSILPIREATPQDQGDPASNRNTLTERQQDVLALLVEGLSNKEIGRRLQLSHFTVRNHVSNILRLLDFHCRRDLREALRSDEPECVADACVGATHSP